MTPATRSDPGRRTVSHRLSLAVRIPPRPLRALALAVAWAVVFLAWIALGMGGVRETQAFDDLGTLATAAAAAGACAWAAGRFHGRQRWAWTLIAVGCASWGVGEAVWSLYEVALRVAAPFPSLADVFYLAAVPSTAAGIALLPAPRRRPVLVLRAVVDGVLIAAGLLWVSWILVGQRIAEHAASGAPGFALGLAYPIGDVIIVTAAAYAAAYSSREVRPVVLTVAAGWAAAAVADSAFWYATSAGVHQTGQLSDAGWALGLGLIGAAGVWAGSVGWPPAIPDRRPLAASFVVYGLIAFDAVLRFLLVPGGPLTGLLYFDAVAVLLLLLLRQVLVNVDGRHIEEERATALRALRASEARLEQVLANVPVSVFAFDAAGRCTLARGSAVPNPEEQVGKFVEEFDSEAARRVFARAIAGTATSGQVETGQGRLIELHCTPLLEGGRVKGMVGVGLDVTERVTADRARRESAAKDRFLANMSHELRTPLNSILGFTQLLGRDEIGTLNERQQRYQQNVLASGSHLLELINELLDLSKARAGELDVVVESVGIVPIVEESVESVRPQAEAAGLTLAMGPVRDLVAQADGRRLRQVLLNVLSNAVKFTPPGGEIKVEAWADRGMVRIEVADTGIGIEEADRERIFEEFTQLDTGRRRGVAGTGLGLALARALARKMGGDIRVAAREPAGSVFAVLLPAAPVPD